MQSRPRGMIFAAGLGTRLKPLTLERPKPLMEIMGQPLIGYALSHLHRANVEKMVINTHYLGSQIEDALGDYFEGVPIHYLHEPVLLDTGGGLKNARHLLQHDDTEVLIINGDTIIDLNIDDLFVQHRRQRALATLMLKTVEHPETYGAVGTDEQGLIRSLVDHVPYRGPKLLQRMFCGTHLLSSKAFDEFPDQTKFSIIDSFYAPLIASGKPIAGVEQRGYYCDAGKPLDLFKANMDILAGREQFQFIDFFSRFDQKKARYGEGAKPIFADSIWLGRDIKIASDVTLNPPVMIDDRVEIAAGAVIGPYAIVGKDVKIGKKAEITQAVILSGSAIHVHEVCTGSIAGKNCRVKIEGR